MRKILIFLNLLVALTMFTTESTVTAAPASTGKEIAVADTRKPQTEPGVRQTAQEAVPRYFEQNLGQWPAAQAFRAYGFGYSVALGHNNVTLQLTAPGAPQGKLWEKAQSSLSREVSLSFEGANSTSQLKGVDELPAKGAWFAGPEKDWRSNISLYQSVRMARVSAGVDAAFYGRDGQLEYDLDAAPGAKVGSLVMDLDGADQVAIGKDGNLTIDVAGQRMMLRKPLAWQAAGAGQTRQAVDVCYALLPADSNHARRIGFKLGQYDPAKALTIDPVLTFATYLTSATSTLPDYYVADVTLDSANNVYILSTDQSYSSMTVQKLSPTAALLYTATFASSGSSSNNLYPVMIRANASGQAYIAASDRGDFPTTSSGYQPNYPNSNHGGAFNAALAVLSASGSTLTYSTYFGGTANGSYGPDYAFALAVDASGDAYLAGWASGGSFPVTAGALQTQYTSGNQSGFVAKFNPTASGAASLVYSTLLGGQYTYLNGIAVDSSGDSYVTVGNSSCTYGIPNTAGAFVYSGINTASECGYVTELNPTGTATIYSAYLGPGTPTSVAVDSSKNAYLTGGGVYDDDFPTTTGAYQTVNPDGFSLELNPTGGLTYSTFLSGPSGVAGGGKVYPTSIAIPPGCSSACTAYISGQTFASDFPVVNGLGVAPPTVGQGNNYAAFLVALNGTGTAALTSGYLNGLTSFQEISGNGTGYAGQGQSSAYTPHVAVDSNNNAWLAGSIYYYGETPDFPVTTAGAAGPTGSWLAEVSMANSGTVIAVPNTLSFGAAVPVNVNSTAYSGTPTTISLRNLGSAPVAFSSVIASPSVFTETDDCDGAIPAAGNCAAQVSFTPTTDAAVNGTLTITSNGVNSPVIIPLSGQGADIGYIQVSPTSLNFGNVTTGTVSAPQTVTLTNIGDEPFGYLSYEAVNPGYNFVTNCPATLPPGNSCQVQVTFAPGASQVGPVAGALQNNYNAIQQVALSGVGVLPAGTGGSQILTFTGTTLNFGTETVGAASPAQSVYMTNTGTQPVAIQVPTLTITSSQGSASDFQVSAFGSINLLPTAYTNFYVTFTPSTATMETATLAIPIAGSSTPYVVTLVGQGVSATKIVEFEPGNWDFQDQVVGTPSAAATFYVYNTGSAPFLVDRVLITGDFSISNNGCAGVPLLPATAPGANDQYCAVYVVFNPSQAGARTGTLTVVDAASVNPQTIPLAGNGIVAIGSASVTPTQLDFGTQNKGSTSAIQNVYVTNQGSAPLTVTGAATTGDYAAASANSSCGVLPYTTDPGGSCYFGVTFTPTVTTSPDNGTLTIQTSAGPQTVTLTGGGQSATLSGLVSPTAINFGSTQAPSTIGAPVYVINTGTEVLKFTGATAVSGVYSISDGCSTSGGGTLNPGQDCVLTVYFSPTGAATYTGSMTVKTNAGNLVVSLSGTGTSAAPHGQFFPPAASFDQQAVNSVSAPMTISFFYGGTNPSFALTGASITAGSSAFQLATGINALNTCSASVGSTTSCQVNVVFSPTVPGLETGTLTVTSTVGNFAITLSGYAPPYSDTGYFSPGALNFPAQVVSTTSIYLYNTGAAPFTIGNIGGTNFGATSEFQVDLGSYGDQCSGQTLVSADDESGTGGVCYVGIQFAPSAGGARSGVLSVPVTYADGTKGSFTANLTGLGVVQKNNAVLSQTILAFPDAAVGTTSIIYGQYVYLTNSGNLPLTVGTLTGTNAAVGTSTAGEFTGNDECSGTTVAVGSYCYINLGFLPTAAGAQTGSITFPVTYANASTSTPFTLALSGNGIAANPSIVLSPSSAQFGPVTAGLGNSNSVTVFYATNDGNVPITFTKYTISAGFTVYSDGCTGQTINPGASCTDYLEFSPASATAGTTINGILSLYDNATGSPQKVALNGVSVAAGSQLGFSQNAVKFGTVQTTTSSSPVTVYLVNQGSEVANISTIAISGADAGDFGETDTCAGTAIQPYTSCSITLTFSPAAVGPRTATLKETDNLGGSGRTIALSGTGYAAYAGIELFPNALTFSTQQPVGEGSPQQFFSVTDTGPNSLVIGQITSSDAVEFPITQDGCSGQTIPATGSCIIGVLFAPTTAGAHTAKISIPDNAAGSPQVEPVSGTGVAELTSSVTLAANPTSVAFGTPVALTASVLDQNSKPLTNGIVTFLDGTTVLGTAQVVSTAAGGKTVGTATLNTILVPLGANNISVKYTGGDAVSTSAPVSVTVTGTYPSATTFAASGNAGDYSFIGTVSGGGPIAPTGNVTFTDGQTLLVPGTVALNPTSLTQTFVAAPEDNNLPSPGVVATADVNGDGIPDLITYTGNGIEVQLGNGDGTFKTANTVAGSSPYGIAFGDFNGDGKLDMVAGNGVGIYLGNGDGTFQQTPSYFDSGDTTAEVGVGDFNGDGKLDIVAVNESFDTIDLLLGNGDGTFQPPTSFSTNGTNSNYGTAYSLAVGDFNGDGKLDVAFADTDSEIGVLLGSGNGTFQAAKFSPTANFDTYWITAADVNGDGKLDLVTNDQNSIIGLMLGNGNGTFQAEQTIVYGSYMSYIGPVSVADLNGDGNPDLVVATGSNNVSVSLSNGPGTFQNPALYPTGAYSYWVSVADLNHDGRPDFVVADNQGNSDTIYLNHVIETATLSNTVVPGTGTHPVTGVYAGDGNFAPSTSNTLQLTASLITPTMTLAAEPSSTLPWAQQLSVSVTLAGAYGFVPAPSGTVSYAIDGGTAQPATLSGGTVVVPISQLSVGTHSIAVSYGGDQYYTKPTAQTLPVTIKKANQTITFPALSNVTYGAAPITLAATATSQLPVVFTVVSGPATIANGVLTITGAGSIIVAANQSGNIDWNAATQVTSTFTVGKAPLIVTPNAASKVYGAALPTLSGTVTGLVNGDALGTTINVAYSTTALATSAVGTYNITATVTGTSSADYTVTVQAASLTVTKATLTLTANNLSAVYGAGLPSLTYTVSGLVNGDTAATAYTGLPSLTTTATATSGVGPYNITVSAGTLSSGNYNFQFTVGTLIVTPAPLTVTATSVSSVYGSALPTFPFTFSGFVNGDTAVTATSGTPSLTTTATSKSSVGTYPVTAAAGTLSAPNYNISFTNGTLAITPASLTVTATSLSSVYGTPLPALASTFNGFVNGDSASTAISGTPALSTTAVGTSAAGSYPITAAVGSLTATNYTFIFVPGTLNITKATLTVTAANANSVYGATLPSLTYAIAGFVNGDTATSGTSGLATLSTTATSKSGVGTYAITVSAGTLSSANYNFQYIAGALTITQAPLTLTSTSVSSVYGSALPTFPYTFSGFVNGDTAATATSGLPSLTTTATTKSPVGAYPINPSVGTLASANYSIQYLPGTLTITKATLTVTANNLSIIDGSAIPSLTYTFNGFVNSDTATTALTGAPTLTTTATTASPIGSYPITISQGTLTAANYGFQLVNGTLSITPTAIAATPTFTPAAGSYASAQSVKINDATPGSVIHYTTDGTTPTASSTQYSTAISVSASETIQAIAVAPNYTNSAIASATYTIQITVTTASLSPATLAFPTTTVGATSAAQVITLTNTGNTAVKLGSVSFSGTDASSFLQSATNCPGTLAVSATCTISIEFKPAASGTLTATYSLTDNASNSPQTVALSGTAPTAITVTAALSPSSLTFPATVVGATSTAQVVTLTNNGNTALKLGGVSFSGTDASSFLQSATNCPGTLAASATCTISIEFKPAASGTLTATYSLTDNASNAPQTVALSGTAPTATTITAALSPSSLTFPATVVGATSTAQVVTLTNTGNTAVKLGGVSFSGTDASSFLQSATNCPGTLAASATCTISIEFKPAASGTLTATYSLTDNATNSPQTVTLTGTGGATTTITATLSPSSLTFPATVVGATSAAQVVTLTNTGNAALRLGSVKISGTNASSFLQSATNCPGTLAASATCTISIESKPAVTGTLAATYSLTDNATDSPQTVSLSGAGNP